MGPRVTPRIFESGYQELAIYTIGDRTKHMARLLPDGRWTSKLGGKLDISRVLSGLEGKEYGNVVFGDEEPKDQNQFRCVY